jgi:hypothetical protein
VAQAQHSGILHAFSGGVCKSLYSPLDLEDSTG